MCLPRNDLVVVEGVRERLVYIQYGHSHVRGLRKVHFFLRHVHRHQIAVHNSERLEIRLGGQSLKFALVRHQLHVLMLPYVFLKDNTKRNVNVKRR